MDITRTSTIRILKLSGIFLFSACIIAYAIWRSFNYARGPHIVISSPANGSAVSEKTIRIIGRAERIKQLFLNGTVVTVDEQGNFIESVVIFPGINILTFHGKDQFDRETEIRLQLVGN